MRLRWSGETVTGLIFAQPQTAPQLLELFPSNPRTFARPRDIITHALNKGGISAPALLFITKLELYPRKPHELLTLTCNLIF